MEQLLTLAAFHHPASFFLLTTCLLVSILGFTSPSSPVRFVGLAALPVLLHWTLLAIESPFNPLSPIASCFVGGATGGLALRYLDCILLSRWSIELEGPTSPAGGLKPVAQKSGASNSGLSSQCRSFSAVARSWDALRTLFGLRQLDTPWEVKNVPPFGKRSPSLVPSRSAFLKHTFLQCVVYLFILDLAKFLPQPPNAHAQFGPDRVRLFSRLGKVTGAELATRFAAAVGHWSIMYCLIQLVCQSAAFTAVLLEISEVRAWRPLFGQVRSSWSIRNFWGYVRLHCLALIFLMRLSIEE